MTLLRSRRPFRRHVLPLIVTAGLLPAVPAGLFPAVTANAASAGTCVSLTGGQPPGPSTRENVLLSVTVLSPCDAWAVGYQSSGGPITTLTEHWNGSNWAVVPSPNPGAGTLTLLRSVRAVSATDIWAVGSFNDGMANRTLILRWNGTAWRQVASPSPGSTNNDLEGVRPVSAKDAWAVGSYFDGGISKTLILRWNGQAWKRVPSPSPAGSAFLLAVTATSSSNAWAVGLVATPTGDKTLILHWNGTAWRRAASPNPGAGNSLTAVGATSGTNVWAVGIASAGNADHTLTLHWNGKRWSHVTSPDQGGSATDNDLGGVTVLSARDVWAVGSIGSSAVRQPLILHWDGSRWSRVASPHLGTTSQLLAVSAKPAGNLWAVGSYFDGADLPLAIHCC